MGKSEIIISDISSRCGSYKRGESPVVPNFITMSVVLYGDYYKVVKTVFSKNGDMYIVDYGELGSWGEVVDFADDPVLCSDGEKRIVSLGLVCEGNGNNVIEVRRFCSARLPRFYPVKGRGGNSIGPLVGNTESYIDNKLVVTYHILDSCFNDALRLRILKGDGCDQNMGSRCCELPSDTARSFMEEFTGMQLISVTNKLDKSAELWQKKSGKKNDYWDCCKYNLAAHMILASAQRSDDEG